MLCAPKLVAGVGFEPHDLRVMSPTSYQTALPRDINKWRRKRDSNPRGCYTLSVFKTEPFNHLGISPGYI